MKYKLIKEYPGSPKLGQIALPYTDSKNDVAHYIVDRNDKTDCDFIALSKKWVENQPEYWEKVNDYLWWRVWDRDYFQDDEIYFVAWKPYQVECIPELDSSNNYFKTKEEAEQYIIKNKPCLTLNEVGLILGGLDKKRDVFLELKRIVKSKLCQI